MDIIYTEGTTHVHMQGNTNVNILADRFASILILDQWGNLFAWTLQEKKKDVFIQIFRVWGKSELFTVY